MDRGGSCRRVTLMCSLKRRRFAALYQGPARRHPSLCHPEQSEGSRFFAESTLSDGQMLRCAQHDRSEVLRMTMLRV